jgi:hypothetical protein
MTRHDTLQCVHEPFGDAYYFGPERLAERYENDPQARKESGYEQSTYRTIFDRIARENSEVRLLIFSTSLLSSFYIQFEFWQHVSFHFIFFHCCYVSHVSSPLFSPYPTTFAQVIGSCDLLEEAFLKSQVNPNICTFVTRDFDS